MSSHVITFEEQLAANEAWGSNCGPGALAAVLGLSLETVRPHLRDFDRKRYTNPTMMRQALESIDVRFAWRMALGQSKAFPTFGLARVQWSGPWTKPGVPAAAAYRHTHWIGSRLVQREPDGESDFEIFDVNALHVGGWIHERLWSTSLVPWLLETCEPKADGGWWITHVVEVEARP